MRSVIISEIKWQRIYLEIVADNMVSDDVCFFISGEKGDKVYPVQHSNGRIRINITNVTGRTGEEMLENGKWHLICKTSQDEEIPVLVTGELAVFMENLDRVFPYWNGAYAYIVTFEPEESSSGLRPVMKTAYMRKNKKPHKEYILLESNNMKQAVKKAIVLTVEKIYRQLYKLFYVLRKKDGRHILLMSETKNKIASNLEIIDKRLKERGLDKQLHISYSFHETLNMQSIKVAVYWMKLVFVLAKQDFVLIDDYAPVFKAIDLGNRTKLVQVWHAGLGFKSVGYSRFGKQDSPRPLDSCHRKYDYVVVGSRNLVPVYQEVFGVNKEKFLPFGLPRMDAFLNEKNVEQYEKGFYEKHPELKGRKLILFAPTYRGAGQTAAYYPYEKLDLNEIYEFCGEEYGFVFKMHPFIKNGPEIAEAMQERIFDCSDENVNDLLRICDVLITDYSSVIYEFVLLDKPILFFAFDKEEYCATRGFHWDYDKYAPGIICEDFEGLIYALKSKDNGADRRAAFRTFGYDYTDAGATDRLIDNLLLEKIPSK